MKKCIELKTAAVLVITILLLSACHSNPTKTDNPELADDSEQTEASAVTSVGLEPGTYCYASKTKAHNADGEFNYHFIRLEFDSTGQAEGTEHTIPYGTDAARGSLKGVYNTDEKKFFLAWHQLAEGEPYTQQTAYTPTAKGLQLGFDDGHGNTASLPQLNCSDYNKLFDEYQRQSLTNSLNTSDRTRVLRVLESSNFGYTEEEMAKVRFLEAAIDLNHDRQTTEYLLYMMDPMICGTGGCNLYILDSNGDVLDKISATSLPIYTTVASIEEEQNNRGTWKTLYVYSKGFRQLEPKQGNYPSNASVEPKMLEEQLLAFPEQYQMVMDYVEDDL